MNRQQEATARLRRAFRYPSDDEDNPGPEGMDEQEQEALIARLSTENATRNAQFRKLLLSLPLLTTLPYLPLLFRPATTLFSLLSLTSLFSTAWLLWKLPPSATGIAMLDAWFRKDVGARDAARQAADTMSRRGLVPGVAAGPLQFWLPYLNIGLAFALVLLEQVAGERLGTSHWLGWIGMGDLPLVVYVVIQASKVVMGSVDPEEELRRLKYNFKGA